jgi:hypothetical protein
MSDNLPRPETPGPWVGYPDFWALDLPNGDDPPRRIWLDNVQDTAAIAALPDWIAAHDAAVVRAEKAEEESGIAAARLDGARLRGDREQDRAEKAEEDLSVVRDGLRMSRDIINKLDSIIRNAERIAYESGADDAIESLREAMDAMDMHGYGAAE